jgi:hypothetical protein
MTAVPPEHHVHKLAGAIAGLGKLCSRANEEVMDYIRNGVASMGAKELFHGSRAHYLMGTTNSDYDVVVVLPSNYEHKGSAQEILCSALRGIMFGKGNHEVDYKAKDWCSNVVTYKLSLGGPVYKVDVIFVEGYKRVRPFRSPLQDYARLKALHEYLKPAIPTEELYYAGVQCGEGKPQDYSLTSMAIINHTIARLTNLDRTIYLALKKMLNSQRCPSMVLLALYQAARFYVHSNHRNCSPNEYVHHILEHVSAFAKIVFKGSAFANGPPLDQYLAFNQRKVEGFQPDRYNSSIMFILSEGQLRYINDELDTRFLTFSPWYGVKNDYDYNASIYLSLVTMAAKMTSYDSADPRRIMMKVPKSQGHSLPGTVVWNILAIDSLASLHDVGGRTLDHVNHMLARKVVLDFIDEIPNLFGRSANIHERMVYDEVSTYYEKIDPAIVKEIDQVIMYRHSDIVRNRNLMTFSPSYFDPAKLVDASEFKPAVALDLSKLVGAFEFQPAATSSLDLSKLVGALEFQPATSTPSKHQMDPAAHSAPFGPAK